MSIAFRILAFTAGRFKQKVGPGTDPWTHTLWEDFLGVHGYSVEAAHREMCVVRGVEEVVDFTRVQGGSQTWDEGSAVYSHENGFQCLYAALPGSQVAAVTYTGLAGDPRPVTALLAFLEGQDSVPTALREQVRRYESGLGDGEDDGDQ